MTAGQINKGGRAQKIAYNRHMRGQGLQIGQKFRWTCNYAFTDVCGEKVYYMTSGKLPKDYMGSDGDNYTEGEHIFTICHIHEGHNSYGNFVDYWLNETGEYIEGGGQIGNKAIIINGFDAYKMEVYVE